MVIIFVLWTKVALALDGLSEVFISKFGDGDKSVPFPPLHMVNQSSLPNQHQLVCHEINAASRPAAPAVTFDLSA